MKLIAWLTPLVLISSVVGITYAFGGINVKEPSTKRGFVTFLHDKEIDTYLTSVRGFLLEMPTDKRFGESRVEPVAQHVSPASKVNGYREIQDLTKEYVIRTFVIGTKKPNEEILQREKRSRREVSAEEYRRINPKKLVASSVRMKEVVADQYKRISADRTFVMIPPQVIEPELIGAVLKLKPMLDSKGYDQYSEPITVNGIKGNIMVKAVRPPDKACLSCHANIAPGKPIGYAIATIWKKKKS